MSATGWTRGRPPLRWGVVAGLVCLGMLAALWAVLDSVYGKSNTNAALNENSPVAAIRVANLLDTFGVNTHLGSKPYDNPAALARMLDYLGIRNLRQSSPIDAAGLALMQSLGRLGARFDLIVNGGGPVDLEGAMRAVHQMAPYLNAVEGVNEVAIYPIAYKGSTGIEAAILLQKDLYRAVRTSTDLAGVPVFIFTLGGIDPGAVPAIGDLSAYTDYANVHSYPPNGLRPIFVIHAAIDGGRASAPSKPVVVTETGYYTLPNHTGWGGVPETVQASYLLCLLLDEAVAKVARTYLYDLVDDGLDPQQNDRERHFGLFRQDGSPKPAATALHNLHTILADTGQDGRTFMTRSLRFAADGVPYNHTGNTLAIEKSDGTIIIAIWNEQQLWDPNTRSETALRHVSVRVSFPEPQITVLLHDPLLGTQPIDTWHDVSELTLDLTDHPLLLVLPGGARHAAGRRDTPTPALRNAWATAP